MIANSARVVVNNPAFAGFTHSHQAVFRIILLEETSINNRCNMKKINILYWTFTGLFALAMLLSGIQNALVTPDSVAILNHLGYPEYIIPFLGVAKILGAIAIVVPGIPRLKEWAYAGLFFDLTGATYSAIMTDGAVIHVLSQKTTRTACSSRDTWYALGSCIIKQASLIINL
jgi:uncharacterized membrane protein